MTPWIRTLVTTCLVVCTAPVASAQEQAETSQRVVTVTGTGVLMAAPDMAQLELGVTSRAQTAADALARNTEQMTQVMALLAERGIAEADIQTSNFSVQPVYDRRTNDTPPEITGYTVRNSVAVRLRDLSGLGAVLDAVVQEGANTLDGLSFGVADPQPKHRRAEARAVEDALARARIMTTAAGLTLGPVLRIDATSAAGAPRPMREMAARASDAMPVPLSGGEVRFRAQVRVTVALAD